MKSAVGNLTNIHTLQLGPGEDVLESIQKYCEENNIRSGVMMSGIGSLETCSFYDPQEIPDKPGHYGYVTPIDINEPTELVSMSGMICTDANDETAIHIHASFADQNGNGYAGHLKEGNKVLVTVELVIGEIGGIDMKRLYDPECGVPVFTPVQK